MILGILTTCAFFLSGFFSASETALYSIPREKRSALKDGDSADKRIAELLDNGEETLIMILLGNLFVNITAITLTSRLMEQLKVSSLFMQILYTTLLLLIFGEIIPKNIAILHGRPIARATAGPLKTLGKIFRPLVRILSTFNRTMLHLNYRYLLQSPEPFITAEEYEHAVQDSIKHGTLSDGAGRMISSYLQLADNPISTIAIHRGDLKKEHEGKAYSLIYEKADIIAVEIVSNSGTKREEADWFPITQDIGTLHDFFLLQKRNTALLTDEYGDFYGIATRDGLYKYWQKSARSSTYIEQEETLLQGSQQLVEVPQWFPSELLEKFPESKTVNGLLTSWLETIPTQGQKERFQSYIFDFEKVEPNRIVQVRIYKEQ